MMLKAQILKKLRRHGYWGGRHTSFDELPKGTPKHLHGTIKDIAEELIKEELLLSHPTAYGLQVSLNPKRKADIDEIIKECLGEEP